MKLFLRMKFFYFNKFFGCGYIIGYRNKLIIILKNMFCYNFKSISFFIIKFIILFVYVNFMICRVKFVELLIYKV